MSRVRIESIISEWVGFFLFLYLNFRICLYILGDTEPEGVFCIGQASSRRFCVEMTLTQETYFSKQVVLYIVTHAEFMTFAMTIKP